jgi:NADPH:quinone reductase-like Zn-dependent oxidoreductase
MQAVVFTGVDQPLACETRPELQPHEGQAVVELKAAALNRRDFWITRGLYPGIKTPCVLGSDGAGVVARIGQGVSESWLGREVILYPGIDWGQNPEAQGRTFRVLGMPDDGTFATSVAVPAELLFPKPPHLSWQEAAALPLAGVTAYRAVCVQGTVRAGQRVLVTGIGGGVATYALQFALAAKADVWVTSSSPRKIQHAVSLGAKGGFDYRNAGWYRELLKLSGPLDLIVDSAGGDGYADLIEAAGMRGRIVSYGATAGRPAGLDLFKVFWKQLHLIGSTLGSPQDFESMLDLVNRCHLRPVIDQVFSLDDAQQAIARMERAPQFGKLVLNCGI